MKDLAGKVAVVTGGTKGIGQAIVEALAAQGASAALCSRNEEQARTVAAAISARGEGRVAGYGCDVRRYAQVRDFVARVAADFGGLDILVNNAGVGVMRTIDRMDPEAWHTVVDTNLNGVYYCCYEAIPHLKKRGGGFIINIASLAGKNAFRGGTAYNASKFALVGFSEALMQDVRYDGIRVSYIMPGSVKTDFAGITAGIEGDWKSCPEDVASVVLELLRQPPRTLLSRIEMRPSQPRKG